MEATDFFNFALAVGIILNAAAVAAAVPASIFKVNTGKILSAENFKKLCTCFSLGGLMFAVLALMFIYNLSPSSVEDAFELISVWFTLIAGGWLAAFIVSLISFLWKPDNKKHALRNIVWSVIYFAAAWLIH